MRPRALSTALVGLVALAALSRPAGATPVFIKNATETTITQVLRPWTQTEACTCCVCWETALANILAFWDDQSYGGAGPWKLLLPGGNGFDPAAFEKASNALYTVSGVACEAGMGGYLFNQCGPSLETVKSYANGELGYSFTFDDDSWVWWGTDIRDPIDAGRPVYYAYTPEQTSGHAVTVVGYEDSTQTLFIYKNWQPVLTQKGFDEATDHCAGDIIPGGVTPAPAGWTCASSHYATNDGCDCSCGAPDPDCEDPSVPVKNCSPGQTCSAQGTCTSTCTDECTSGAKECINAVQVRVCGEFDADGCLEWGLGESCEAASSCQAGACVGCPDACTLGTSRCQGTDATQMCVKSASGCTMWSAAVSCPPGSLCGPTACTLQAGPDAGAAPGVDAAPEVDSETPPGEEPPGTSSGCSIAASASRPHDRGAWVLMLVGLLAARLSRRRRRKVNRAPISRRT